MLNITHYQGNKNQNHNEIYLTLSEWLKLTTWETIGVFKDAEKGEYFCTAGGDAFLCSHSGKQYGNSSKI